MRRKSVSSTNLASIGYNSVNATLEIEFHTGSVYQYAEVPEVIFSELMKAKSHGHFFNQNIRNGYSYFQVM